MGWRHSSNHAAAGLPGEWEQPHGRVWSSTIRFETTQGRVWFKVNASGTAQEPGLLALLGEICPGLALDVVAYDDARAWSLTRDGGPTLRSRAEPDGCGPIGRDCCPDTLKRSSPWPNTGSAS